MRRRFHLIGNLTAGRGRDVLAQDVASRLQSAGATVDHSGRRTASEALAHAAGVARSGRIDAVIAAGGDGTIRLAAKAVGGTGIPLGVIPLGTGNVLAHEIGLPRDAGTLARILLVGAAAPIETATANGELFLLMAGVGLDGRIVGALDHGLKNRIGKLAYLRPALGAVLRGGDRLEVSIDGVAHEAGWAVIANARCYGGAFAMAPRTGIDRPGLQAVLFHGDRLGSRIAQLLALARDRLDSRARALGADVSMHPCTRVRITSAEPVPTQLDGDAFASTPLVIEFGGPEVLLIRPAPVTG